MSRHLLSRRASGLLVLIVAVAAWAWRRASRSRLTCCAIRGSLYEDDDGGIENVYRLHIMNTDESTHRYALSVGGVGGIGIV